MNQNIKDYIKYLSDRRNLQTIVSLAGDMPIATNINNHHADFVIQQRALLTSGERNWKRLIQLVKHRAHCDNHLK